MIHILLLILKIILWIILAILGIALLLVLLVLFMPIKYRAEIDYHDKAKVRAKVNYLIVSVRIVYDQAAGNMDNIIRICGIRFGGKKKKPKTKKLKKSPKSENEKLSSDKEEVFVDEEIKIDGMLDDKSDYNEQKAIDYDIEEENVIVDELKSLDFVESDTDSTDNTANSKDIGDNKTDKSLKKLEKERKKQQKLEQKEAKKEAKQRKKASKSDNKADISSKLDVLKRKADRFKKFWELECTVKTREYLGKYIISIFKHIGPRRIKGYVNYGFDDPCTTGKVTGYLSLMPFVYRKGFSLSPDFHNKILEAEIKMKGHIRLAYIVRIVFKVNIWRTIKAAKKYLAE